MTSWPSTKIRPLVGSISRLIIFSVVDLPHPDGPTRHTISPGAMSRSRSCTATVPSEYRFPTPSSLIIGSPGDRDPEVAVAFMGVTLPAAPGADGISIQPSCYNRTTNHWICLDYLKDRHQDLTDALVQHLQITLAAL